MNRALIKKCLTDAQWLFLALGVLLFGFCWLRVWIVSLLETPRFAVIIEQFWDKFGQLSPVSFAELISYSGRVALTYLEPVVVFGLAIWAIARGSDVVSGELGRGTMEMLLGQPIRRSQVLWTQAAVTIAGGALLCAICWCGIGVGIHYTTVTVSPPSEWRIPLINIQVPNPLGAQGARQVPLASQVHAADMVPPAVNLFAFCICVAGIATLMSSWDRYRWRTIGIVSGFYIVETILKVVSVSAPHLNWLRWWTFVTAFEPQWFAAIASRARTSDQPQLNWAVVLLDEQGQFAGWGPMGHNGVLVAIGLAAYLAAAVIFSRRDLPAPI